MNNSRSPSPADEPSKHEDEMAFERSPIEDNTDPENNYCDVLKVENIPVYWSVEKISTFIREITKAGEILDNITFVTYVKPNPKENLKDSNSVNQGCFLVKFTNAYYCGQAFAEWTGISHRRNIKVNYDYDNLYEKKEKFRKPFLKRPKHNPAHPLVKKQKISHDTDNSSNSANFETYGLSVQFLNNLNIQLPIGSKLFIHNLNSKVTVEKIREVFGFAGQIVHATLYKQENHDPPKCYAKVQYDHPVEAVQAISMFNKQKLYSWPMAVRMDSKPTYDLPEGLSGMGTGLGPNGEPLRGIRNYIELQPIKQKLMLDNDKKDFGTSNSNMFNISPFIQPDKTMFNQMANSSIGLPTPMVPQMPVPPVPMPIQATNQNMNPFGQQSTINPFNLPGFQNLQMLQNSTNLQQAVSMLLQNKMNSEPMGQSSDHGGNGNSEWQPRPKENDKNESDYSASKIRKSYGNYRNSDYGNRSFSSSDRCEDRDSRKTSRDHDESSRENSDMLIFKNLPHSVTLQALRNKMQEVGDVKFSEITGQGRAIVRFTHSRDAERCIKLFNKSKVDGQVIDVRYF
ncbi:uncharacterized protein LOC115444145 [Manduca sexta]|uniref:RRM domain-containing protein n=1 Tax=Manduca sexta TaxID=7130 RepID=A0A921Z4Z5_MANSE|nr:uncharacterized protein LOC115444145 [Manduca sexta]KAG6451080.1 hypothetical protein O3G_MSEX006904 [Manduca sexta]